MPCKLDVSISLLSLWNERFGKVSQKQDSDFIQDNLCFSSTNCLLQLLATQDIIRLQKDFWSCILLSNNGLTEKAGGQDSPRMHSYSRITSGNYTEMTKTQLGILHKTSS
jgi:hypothetical protein